MCYQGTLHCTYIVNLNGLTYGVMRCFANTVQLLFLQERATGTLNRAQMSEVENRIQWKSLIPVMFSVIGRAKGDQESGELLFGSLRVYFVNDLDPAGA